MAIRKTLIDQLKDNKKKGHFLEGLKAWVVSPGGIITIVAFVGLIWYIHHATSKAKA